MEIKQLRVFLSVCETGSFTATAKVFNYAQSSISDMIKSLETSINCKLFDRIGKKIYLTPQGYILKEKARDIVSRHDEALAVLNGDLPRTLTVGITESLCTYKFPTFFRAFIEKHPKLNLNFVIARCEEIHQMTLDHQIDIGFTLDDEINDKRISAITLFEEEIVFIKGANSTLGNELKDLSGEKYLLSKGKTGYNRLFYECFTNQAIELGNSIIMESIEGIKSYVKQGFGFSFMPYATVAQDLENKQLKLIQTGQMQLVQYVQILIHKDKYLTDDLKHLMDFAKATYTNRHH